MKLLKQVRLPNIFIFFIFILFFCSSVSFSQTSCSEHIKNFISPDFKYPQNAASKAIILGMQRQCLHAKNISFSDSYNFDKKMSLLLPISSDFNTRKNIIHFQESAEAWDIAGNKEKSSLFVDKLNVILADNLSKHKAAVILLEQAQRNMISEERGRDIFYKTQDYLLNYKKCKPGVCDGYATVSFVASQFPVCAQDSCLNYVTYESLYLTLAAKLGKEGEAASTVKKLLAKDFGTARSNGEVKGPLVPALALFDAQNFEKETKYILDEAASKRTQDFSLLSGGYDEQDALLVRPVMEYLAVLGGIQTLKNYARGDKGSAPLEANLALALSPISQEERAAVRKNLEKYYTQTSACIDFGVNLSHDPMAAISSKTYLTRNAELDLQLRQRISQAYWTDGQTLNALKAAQTPALPCAPARGVQKIDGILVTKNIVQAFVRDNVIDSLLFAPLAVGVGAAQAVKAIKSAPKFVKQVHYIDFAQNARRAGLAQSSRERLQKAMVADLRRSLGQKQAAPLKIAVGQDFFDDGARGAGKLGRLEISNRTLSYEEIEEFVDLDNYGAYQKISSVGKGGAHTSKANTPGHPSARRKNLSKKELKSVRQSDAVRLAREKEEYEHIAKKSLWPANLGHIKTSHLARIMGVEIRQVPYKFTEPSIIEILRNGDLPTLDRVIQRVDYLSRRYPVVLGNKSMRFEYVPSFGRKLSNPDMADIKMVVEEGIETRKVTDLFNSSGINAGKILNRSGMLIPQEPKNMAEVYIKLTGGTVESPSVLRYNELDKGFRLYSADGKNIIRVASHEYGSSGLPHVHFYKNGRFEDVLINNRLIVIRKLNGDTERFMLPYEILLKDPRVKIITE